MCDIPFLKANIDVWLRIFHFEKLEHSMHSWSEDICDIVTSCQIWALISTPQNSKDHIFLLKSMRLCGVTRHREWAWHRDARMCVTWSNLYPDLWVLLFKRFVTKNQTFTRRNDVQIIKILSESTEKALIFTGGSWTQINRCTSYIKSLEGQVNWNLVQQPSKLKSR